MKVASALCLLMSVCGALVGAGAHFLIPRPQLRQDATNSMTLCGRHLAEARMLYCYEQGYAPKKKASLRPIMSMNEVSRYDDREDMVQPREEFLRTWPWLERHHANSFALDGRGKRDGPGLVDECCLKPCTLDELLNYC